MCAKKENMLLASSIMQYFLWSTLIAHYQAIFCCVRLVFLFSIISSHLISTKFDLWIARWAQNRWILQSGWIFLMNERHKIVNMFCVFCVCEHHCVCSRAFIIVNVCTMVEIKFHILALNLLSVDRALTWGYLFKCWQHNGWDAQTTNNFALENYKRTTLFNARHNQRTTIFFFTILLQFCQILVSKRG